MGLSIALNNALSGLNVNQQQLAVLSQNISNANTPGYSKQTAVEQAVYINGQGEGVQIGDITRTIDEFLVKAVQQQNSAVGQTGVIDDYNTRIQLLLGTPGGQNSIDSYLNNYFNALQSLSQTPQDTTLQQSAVSNGVTLATQVSSLASGLQNLQFQADQDIGSAVTKLNSDLKNLRDLNILINNNMALGNSVAGLQDQRDSILSDMSQYIDIHTFTKSNGTISVTTAGGQTILDNDLYQFSYTPAGVASAFSSNAALPALTLARVDDNGNPTSTPAVLVTSAPALQVTTLFTSGKIAGLLNLRDQALPNILNQLDTLASSVRDDINSVHNAGSGYPGTNSLTGTRAVFGQDSNQWSGSARIAILDATGQPILSPYSDEPNGVTPLTLNLGALNSGAGAGITTVQNIIDSINQYYGVPQNKAEVGNLNNIQLVSDNKSLPTSPPLFNFDFNLNNISGNSSNFYVTNVQVQDSTGADMTSVTSTIPSLTLDPTNTYTTTAGSGKVVVSTTSNNNLTNGEVVFLSTPPGSVDGIPGSNLGGYFTVSNVTANSFQITAASTALTGTITGVAGQTVLPPYATAATGGNTRTSDKGLLTADLTANTSSPFYTITATVGVNDGSGNVRTSQVTYRVNNQQPNILNAPFGASAVTGDGTLVTPNTLRPLATATLVDANGVELPKLNGVYTNAQSGFLKISAGNSSNMIAIDSLDSKELGQPIKTPPLPGTGWGFSHYFDLNDFFHSNQPTNTGDTLANSALNLTVEQRIQNNPGLLSIGQLSKLPNPIDPTKPPNYTYSLNPGDNSTAQALSALSSANIDFNASGGLGATVQTFSGYAGQIIGSASTKAATGKTDSTNAQTLLTGYSQQSSAVSGVNLDTELANTVVYQNAYAASARIITVANTLFDTLLQAFQ